MDPRNEHPLETALKDDIRAHRNARAKDLIKIIQKPDLNEVGAPSLMHFDKQGLSFLYHAIESKNIFIARHLLSLQSNNRKILFAEQSLFYAAAKSNFSEIMPDLVEAIRLFCINDETLPEDAADFLEYKNWLHGDNKGVTPLHCAAQLNHYEAVIALIALIQKEPEAINLISQKNNLGKNLLHLLLETLSTHDNLNLIAEKGSLDCRLINLFITLGVSLEQKGIAGKSPIKYFLDMPFKVRVAIFKQLDKKAKTIVLNSIHRYIAENYNNIHNFEQVKKEYFDLALLDSLRAYLVARMEFDPSIPLKEFVTTSYPKTITQGENKGKVKLKEGKVVYKLMQVPFYETNIAQAIPRYSIRVFRHKKTRARLEELNLEKLSNTQNVRLNLEIFDMILNELNQHIERIQHLPNPRWYLQPFVGFLTYASLITGFFSGRNLYSAYTTRDYARTANGPYSNFPCNNYQAWQEVGAELEWQNECETMENSDSVEHMFYAIILFGVTCLLLAIMSCMLTDHYRSRTSDVDFAISDKEWASFVKLLEGIILNPDLLIPRREQDCNTMLNKLQDDIQYLNNHKEKRTVIKSLHKIKSDVTYLKEQIASRNKPLLQDLSPRHLSLFANPPSRATSSHTSVSSQPVVSIPPAPSTNRNGS